MLIVPPSTVNSCSFSFLIGRAPLVSASDGNLGVLRAEVMEFGCGDTAKGIVLFIIAGPRSIGLNVVVVLISESTGFVAVPGMFGATEKTKAGGVDTPFIARD